ncbi:mucin-5AC-like isoform X1 [Pseudomyrmex gracilis]|uniref:mucin-5AC-like isoform X1 n=1 Tax=Pseudomyrmex gracilis TaxID=219809 RepID=UPI000994EA34|nr:mucin-5AC-like isoform X1 [Pseudomyrmex gracilis]
MDIRIFALFVFVSVLGSFAEARASFFGYPFENGGATARLVASPRLKRAVDSNGETTTKPTTTSQATTPKSTDPTTTSPPTTTPPSTSPTTTPTTETTTTAPTTTTTTATTTTEATSPTTTPTTTSATTPTTPATTTPEPSTTTPTDSTKPTSKPKKPVDVLSRSNIDDEPEESTKKPGPSSKNDIPRPFSSGGTFGPGFNPYYGYPGFNSIPGSNPNYAWTGTSNGQGFASAGASAGSFAGGYPGYSTGGFPGAVSPLIGSRGGFQDNTPNQNMGYGYNGIDPWNNAGAGQFFFPEPQFPYNNPFDMFRQIQAQIEAQHQANMELQNRLANEASYGGGSYGGGSYGGGVPQVASASIGLGPGGGYQMGQISPAAPGLQSRFAEELPAPSGNSYGVFSSSSSSSMTGPDGKQVNRKSSITGVNDNGKVSFREVHD